MPAQHLDRPLLKRMGLPVDGPPPTPEAVRRWQFARLRETLATAREAGPFHANRFGHVDLDALRGPEDMARVPRTMAEDLRRAPGRMLCVSQDEIERIVTLRTSGSTGTPKRLFFTREDLERTVDFFHHGMASMARSGDTVLALLPAPRPDSVGNLLVQGVERLGARCVAFGEPWRATDALDLLLSLQAAVVVGTPVHVHALGRLLAASGEASPVRHALLCWDSVPPGLAERIRADLGCAVATHWGMTETGLGGAVTCGEGTGMHLREADLYVEIAAPDTGRPLPDGDWGEITVSTLSRRGMPLIRYRSGDLGRILPGACACGSPQRRLDAVPGRLNDGAALPGGARLARRDLDAALLALPGFLDCDAELSLARAALDVGLWLLPGQDEQAATRAARDALQGLPGLGGEALALNISVNDTPGALAPGFGKRDLRAREDDP
ncbi:DVU_1553 family AMP-dependent CoA ligase [Desulfocurvus sp. DL9XJH121]